MLFYPFVIFFLCALLVYKSRFFRMEGIQQWEVTSIYALKVLAGYVFIYLYTYHYGDGNLSADAGVFISESKIINNLFFESPWSYIKLMFGFGEHDEITREFLLRTHHWDVGTHVIINDNKNVLRGNSILHFFSFGIPIIHSMIYSLFGLLGLKYIHQFAQKYSVLNPRISFYILVFLLSSLFFWTSTFLKEPLLILGISFFLHGLCTNGLTKRKRIIILSISIVLLLGFKPYVIICILPGLFISLLFYHLRLKHFLTATFSFLILFVAVWNYLPNLSSSITERISKKQSDFVNISKGGTHVSLNEKVYYIPERESKNIQIKDSTVILLNNVTASLVEIGLLEDQKKVTLTPEIKTVHLYFRQERSNSYFETTPINNNPNQLIKNIPEALFNVFFRPFPTQLSSTFHTPTFVEYILIYLFLIMAIVFKRKITHSETSIVLGLIVFSFTLSMIIGWVTPVSGAIVRYRIPVHLSIVLIGMILVSPKKLSAFFRLNRK